MRFRGTPGAQRHYSGYQIQDDREDPDPLKLGIVRLALQCVNVVSISLWLRPSNLNRSEMRAAL